MSAIERRIVGRRLPRLDGVAKVTGKLVYAADFALPGMLVGRIFRSTVPHAVISRIDVSRARAIPGVRAVLTSADISNVRFSPAVKDITVLAQDRVRFVGHPVAAIAATSVEIAEQALAAIEIDYEPLPAIFDPEEALAE
ncbi:MAG: hypothetical protein JWQ07_5858, partial [Ramlibacter sp.]|nr:hypothetical protein [Ramlibacter sp.]